MSHHEVAAELRVRVKLAFSHIHMTPGLFDCLFIPTRRTNMPKFQPASKRSSSHIRQMFKTNYMKDFSWIATSGTMFNWIMHILTCAHSTCGLFSALWLTKTGPIHVSKCTLPLYSIWTISAPALQHVSRLMTKSC